MPPMIIWDRKTLSPTLTNGEVDGTIHGLSAKGWIDRELFDAWFETHFLRYAPLDRPVLLLLDGHSSHYCPETILRASKQDVVLFTLPPHTSHLSQPLDKGCFGPLKMKWWEVCHKYMTEHPGIVVTRYSFSKLLTTAWNSSMTINNILSGFATTGIYPLSREAVLSKIPMAHSQEPLTVKSNLTFIPMCSPISSARQRRAFKSTVVKFQKKFEREFDEVSDERYNRWLVQTHPGKATVLPNVSRAPDSNRSAADKVDMPHSQPSCISKFLSFPSLPLKLPPVNPKSYGLVLISHEYKKEMEEKRKIKLENEQKKQKARQQREKKRWEKAERNWNNRD